MNFISIINSIFQTNYNFREAYWTSLGLGTHVKLNVKHYFDATQTIQTVSQLQSMLHEITILEGLHFYKYFWGIIDIEHKDKSILFKLRTVEMEAKKVFVIVHFNDFTTLPYNFSYFDCAIRDDFVYILFLYLFETKNIQLFLFN